MVDSIVQGHLKFAKLNTSANFRYTFIILWETRQRKSFFNLKDGNYNESHVVYESECSFEEGSGGNDLYLEVLIAEHSHARRNLSQHAIP